MKKREDFVTDALICECHSADHLILLNYWEDDIGGDVYMSIHLKKRSFRSRLYYGIKYIFGRQSRYGAFDEIIIRSQDVDKLERVVKYLKKKENK